MAALLLPVISCRVMAEDGPKIQADDPPAECPAEPVPPVAPTAGEDGAPEQSPPLTRLLAFALGFDQPLDGGGKNVPLIVVRAIGDRYLGPCGKARFSYDTTSGSAVVEAGITGWLFAGVTGHGNWLTARSSTYRYDEGERLEELEVNSTCLGGGPVAGLRFGKIEIRAFLQATRYWYHEAGLDHAPGFVRPADHLQGMYGLELSYSDLRSFRKYELSEGFEGSLKAWYFSRDRWSQWGPPGLPQTLEGRDREGAVVHGKFRASFLVERTQELRVTLSAAAGIDVDVFTGLRAGSMIGEVPVPGYYYSELICDRVLVASGKWALDLWEGARGWATATLGVVRMIGDEILGVAGISVGLTQKIFLGIPVTIEYAFSPTARRRSGAGGHELYVLVAIGFF